MRSVMKRVRIFISAMGLYFVISIPAACQELRLEDAIPGDSTASAIRNAPLSPSLRAGLEGAMKVRDYGRAETLLIDEIERSSKSPKLLTLLGGIFFLDGKYLSSASAMKKAEALGPLDDRSRFTLAMAYIILNHRDWARPELDKLARLDPQNALYPYWLSRLDYDAMQFSAAVANARKAISVDPHFYKAYDNLGLSYEALGKYDDALQAYRDAMRLNGESPSASPWPHLNAGAMLVKLGRWEEAEGYLRESLRYDPKLPQAHYHLGLLLEKQKKDAEAIRELQQATSLNPSYAEPYQALGKIYHRIGDEESAQTAFETFQRLKKQHPAVRPH
jgi:tetratricopeptide (TPR) repeat protein